MLNLRPSPTAGRGGAGRGGEESAQGTVGYGNQVGAVTEACVHGREGREMRVTPPAGTSSAALISTFSGLE